MNDAPHDDGNHGSPPRDPPPPSEPPPPSGVDEQVSPEQSAAALKAIGLDAAEIEDWVRRGEWKRDNSSRHYPRWHLFQVAPAEIIKCMRDALVPRGWLARDIYSLATAVSPDRTFALVVWTGDKNTGNPTAFGRNRYKRGEDSRAAFDVRQLDLSFGDADPDEGESESVDSEVGSAVVAEEAPKDFWVMLRCRVGRVVYVDFNRVRHEDISGAGYIERSRCRISLPPIDLDAVAVAPVEPAGPIDVPVEPHQPPSPPTDDVAKKEK